MARRRHKVNDDVNRLKEILGTVPPACCMELPYFHGKKRGYDGDYLAAVKGWSECSREENLCMYSSVETWGLEGFDCSGYGVVSRRGGGGMPWKRRRSLLD
ncbi:hypothetical protein F2Q68_00017564 [Brassica cretica]|uniref:Uncharacterized protein n=1 Tax=Brassica cretica TaxID=69181 RepID=A0A8S9H8B5_BRACR|nr:hypothetical protein F2Q68_00017564 [Brassica cretica]